MQEVLANEVFRGCAPVVKQVGPTDNLNDFHVLFITRTQQHRLPRLLALVQDDPVLTVGESEDFAALGGALSFLTAGEGLRTEVNLRAVARGGLRLSSKLAAVVKVVGSPTGPVQ
jgi:hypothetical protein